jgi:hypothetical protein
LVRSYFLIFIVLSLALVILPTQSEAQTRSYEVLPAPSIGYNSIDGIRLGLRLKGQVPGTFEDGPHRLEAGFWFGAWLPDLPVSYHISFTEPISAWSEYGSEASVQAITSVRTGYHIHGLGFNKRWQTGFDERRYRELSIFNTFEKRFDDEYTAFPLLWSDQSKVLTTVTAELQNDNPLGWYNIELSGSLQYLDQTYGVANLTAIQRIPFNDYWGFRLRGFLGAATSQTAPEYLFSRSSNQAINWMRTGLTRAKGTIPQRWMESGNFQVAGGANLRGYTSQDVELFNPTPGVNEILIPENYNPGLFTSIASVNAEFDYLNPVALLFNRIPYVSEFISFRSYLFFDAGRSLGFDASEPDDLFADAGAGFSLSLNIPDYLGKPRGFVLRYEIPFWLSKPGMEDSLKMRHLFALGAVISF